MAGDATYCRVLPTFWTDPKVKRKLTREQKHLLLYLFTSPHTNLIGLFYLPLAYAEMEAEISVAEIQAWIAGPLAPFVSYDYATEEILVHRAARHQIGEELKAKDNRHKAVERILRDTHSAELVARFRTLYPEWPLQAPAAPSEVSSPLPSGPENKGLPSPLPSPSEAIAVAVAGTEHDIADASTTTTAREKIDESIEKRIDEIILAANVGMSCNPALKAYEPIPPGHGSRQHVAEWIAAGIPDELILDVVDDRASSFQPEGRNRQIHSMKYFSSAVLDEHDRRTAKEKAHGRRRNGTHRRKPDGEVRAAPDQASRRQRGFGT